MYTYGGNGRRHVPCLSIRDAFSQQAADTVDWMVRCDWLQPASCKFLHNIVHAQYYANVGCRTCCLVASVIVVVKGFLITYQAHVWPVAMLKTASHTCRVLSEFSTNFIKQQQQRVAVRPGNAQFTSIRQVPLRDGTYGRHRCCCPATALLLMLLLDGDVLIIIWA